ncbi:MAG TPA: dTMP kinase [Candidatus Microsaccharimonas sp.]|nr:dTMP kinase [Candidatus Microsaccharimonas sp.]
MPSVTIMIDGPDGVGKTTQLRQLATTLTDRGYRVYVTRMNGGTEIGEALRHVLLADYDRPPATDYYIMQAVTAALIEDLAARRAEYDIILVDRSPLALLAYQVHADGFSAEVAYPAVEQTLGQIAPSLLLCLSTSLETIMQRMAERDNSDHFESQPFSYHERVMAGYEAAEQRIQVTMIDANGSVDEVFARIMSQVEPILPVQNA